MDPCIDYCFNRFDKEYTKNCDNNCEYAKVIAENKKLQADLARIMVERDAAISDLTCIARTYPVELCDDLVCQYCKHYPNINAGCPGWTDDDCFEWRGIKKEG